MLVLLLVAQASVSIDWSIYRVGARDCQMRRVDPVSQVVVYGSHDCTPKKASRKMMTPALTQSLVRADGSRVIARVVADAPAAASAPQAKLLGLFPGPASLQVVQILTTGEEKVIAETMGTPREVVGLASDGYRVLVVFRYEKTLRDAKEAPLAIDVLGLSLF